VRRSGLAAAAFAAAALLPACGQEIGEANDWVAAEAIAGRLRPELAPPPAPALPLAAAERLRVVTYNVQFGADPEALAAAILADPELASARLLLVQEIEAYPAEGRSRAARLAEALGMGHVYAPAREEGDGTHGLAILSVFPIEQVAVMELPYVDLPLSGRRRVALAADLQVGAEPLRVITTHLDTRLNITDRVVQLRPAVIDAPARVLVGGDFNTNAYLWVEGAVPVLPVDSVADSDQAELLDDYVRHLDFATPTAGFGPTHDAGGVINLRLDSIFTRGLAPAGGAVARGVELSDHWPLWLDVEVR
jgi:endonuclease/exonuclease/phosphatase family metal-dependent hydrolase